MPREWVLANDEVEWGLLDYVLSFGSFFMLCHKVSFFGAEATGDIETWFYEVEVTGGGGSQRRGKAVIIPLCSVYWFPNYVLVLIVVGVLAHIKSRNRHYT